MLCLLACVICATLVLFADSDTLSSRQSGILYAMYTNVALMIILACVVCRDFIRLWSSSKSKGSILQIKLMTIFSLLAVVPSLLMIFFSTIFFHKGIESWFNARNNAVLQESLKVAESYLDENKKNITDDGLGVARAIEISIASFLPSQLDNEEIIANSIGELMDDLFNMKNISCGILFDAQDHIIARSKYSLSLNFALVTASDMNEAMINGVKIIDYTQENKIFALLRVNFPLREPIFLLIEKQIDEKISGYVKKTKSAYSDYHELAEYRTNLEVAFILIFVILGILLLLAAISSAINFAGQLIVPISNLVDSAQKIRDGNLRARVENPHSIRELDVLSYTFNEMASKIQEQQMTLQDTNGKLDQQIQFITNVLAGVSSGVISLNEKFRINTFNEPAQSNIGTEIKHGMLIFDIFPNAAQSFEKLSDSDMVEEQIDFIRGIEHCKFVVKITKLKSSSNISGYIITFDDITNLISAQRKAAWSDVARRVAHEIKNPLTPIQLAAERLFRKYSKQISSDFDTFKKLTDTIVKQVGDIKRLIDEFSFFARLPEPVLKKCSLSEIIKPSVFFMQNAYQEIAFEISENNFDDSIMCDDRLIHQAVVNIMQNAVNAMKSENDAEKTYKITIKLENRSDYIDLIIDDDGPGLPKVEANVLTEPYFTLTPKGTGLGLAIVKKVMQDHGGNITLTNNDQHGARVILSFPVLEKESQ